MPTPIKKERKVKAWALVNVHYKLSPSLSPIKYNHMSKKYLYKFLREGMKSENGNCSWKVGDWKKHDGEILLCNSGFHASNTRIREAALKEGYEKGFNDASNKK